MPQPPAERWDARVWARGQSATRVIDCPGAVSESDALDQVAAFYSIAYGSRFPLDPQITVPISGLSVTTEKGPLLFTVRAEYARGNTGDSTDPLNRKPTFRWVTGNLTEPVDRDIKGNPIYNSAFDVPSNKPTRKIGILAAYIVRWETDFDTDRWLAFNNTVNADTFRIRNRVVEPGQAFFESMEQLEEATFDADVIKIGYRIELRKGRTKDSQTGLWDGFACKFIDKGRRAFFPTSASDQTPKLANIYTSDDGTLARVGEDVNLNGNGIPIRSDFVSKSGTAANLGSPKPPQGAKTINSPDSSAVYLSYDNYNTSQFGALGIF